MPFVFSQPLVDLKIVEIQIWNILRLFCNQNFTFVHHCKSKVLEDGRICPSATGAVLLCDTISLQLLLSITG